MKIRKANKKDISGILELSKGFIEEHHKKLGIKNAPPISQLLNEKRKIFEKDLLENSGVIFLCEIDNKMTGYIFIIKGLIGRRNLVTKAYISDLFVLKEFRNRGIAKSLISESIAWSKKHKINEVFLDVDYKNPKAKRLYKQLNFEEYSTRLSKKIR